MFYISSGMFGDSAKFEIPLSVRLCVNRFLLQIFNQNSLSNFHETLARHQGQCKMCKWVKIKATVWRKWGQVIVKYSNHVACSSCLVDSPWEPHYTRLHHGSRQIRRPYSTMRIKPRLHDTTGCTIGCIV